MTQPPKQLSREEAKLITRHRLLQAGADLLLRQGYERLTTGRIARRAGVAQPTFYVHFRGKDELLEAIATGLVEQLRRSLRELRAGLSLEGELLSVIRETYRLSLEAIARHADLLRLFMAERHLPQSSIGSCARKLQAEITDDLVDDVARVAAAASIPRPRLQLVCASLIELTIHFGLAMADGRSGDLGAVADILSGTTLALLTASAVPG